MQNSSSCAQGKIPDFNYSHYFSQFHLCFCFFLSCYFPILLLLSRPHRRFYSKLQGDHFQGSALYPGSLVQEKQEKVTSIYETYFVIETRALNEVVALCEPKKETG